MRILALISLLLAASVPAAAQTYSTDAFGVAPRDAGSSNRTNWADTITHPVEVEDVLLFVGQKSHVAGRDVAHAVSVLVDRYGNFVADGTRATMILNGEPVPVETIKGIAEVVFDPGTVAGNFDAAVVSGNMQSARATYRVTADLADIVPSISPQDEVARPENFVAFETRELTDRFGNPAPTGVGAQLVVSHTDGSFSITSATVLDGRASGIFLLRDMADGGVLRSELGGKFSASTDILVEDITLSAPTRVGVSAVPSIEAARVRIGPVTTSAGYYLNDGANVDVEVIGASGKRVTQTGWLRDGHFETVLPIDPEDAPFVVNIETPLGFERTLVERADQE